MLIEWGCPNKRTQGVLKGPVWGAKGQIGLFKGCGCLKAAGLKPTTTQQAAGLEKKRRGEERAITRLGGMPKKGGR